MQKFAFRAFAFVAPAGAFGILVGPYPVSVPAIVGMLLAAICWINILGDRIPVSVLVTSVVAIFVAWMAICTVFSTEWFSFFSLALFLFFSSIVCAGRGAFGSSREVVTWLHLGGAFSIFLVLVEISLKSLGLPSMQHYLSGGISYAVDSANSVARVRAGFQEPAHFAIYLTFLLISLDSFQARGMPRWVKPLAVLYAVALMLTWSLSGLAILISYWMAKRFSSGVTLAQLARDPVVLVVASLLFFLLLVPSHWLFVRLQSIPEAVALIIANDVASGSVATRLMAVTMPGDLYWSGLEKAIFGLGFNAYESWVAETYSMYRFGANQGNIHNALASFGLGGGIPGLIFGFLIFWACSAWKGGKAVLPILAGFLAFAFSYGSVTSYLFWWVLVAGRLTACSLTNQYQLRRIRLGAPKSRASNSVEMHA